LSRARPLFLKGLDKICFFSDRQDTAYNTLLHGIDRIDRYDYRNLSILSILIFINKDA
jgi:hypothetical protein